MSAVQALAKAKRDMEAALAAMDSTLAEMKDKRAFKEAKIKEMEANLAQEGQSVLKLQNGRGCVSDPDKI